MQIMLYNNIYAQPLLLMRVGAGRMTVLSSNFVTATKLFLPTVKENVTQTRSALHSLMKLQPLLITTTATVIKTDHTPLEAVGPIQNVTYWNEVSHIFIISCQVMYYISFSNFNIIMNIITTVINTRNKYFDKHRDRNNRSTDNNYK